MNMTAEAHTHLVNAFKSHNEEMLERELRENCAQNPFTDDEYKIARDRKRSDVAWRGIVKPRSGHIVGFA
jgi:hypothetical protein